MGIWWANLSSLQQIFYPIAISTSVVLGIQIILNLIGLAAGDLDLDGIPDALEAPGDVDVLGDGNGLSMISSRTILAFFVGFGWGGVVATKAAIGPLLSVFIAMLIGVLFMLVVFWLMRQMWRLTDSGNIAIVSAVGQSGIVYVPIPAQKEGVGQVQIRIQGRLREFPAITDEASTLPTNSHIRVLKIMSDDMLLVRQIDNGVESNV